MTPTLNSDNSNPFMKGPKRKRLAKACDACHKSKRRCDGTAPCSNCYYASKQCTYTDASGRSVPAPRPFKPEKQDSQPSSSSDNRPYSSSQFNPVSDTSRFSNQLRIYNNPSSSFQNDSSDDDHKHSRKRFRNGRGNPLPVEDLTIEGPISGVSIDRPTSIELDPSLTRELTNLFFTHCHPARAVIHKPTFSADLSHNRVPSHLLLAVCALAAPLSKQPRFRTTPARFAGKPFAQEALSQMFDGAGRLVCEPDLAAAQALCILQMHDIVVKEKNMVWGSRYHEADLALQIVESLGVHSPEHPTLTPVPSQEFVLVSLEREAIRRIFWLIHLLDVIASIYFKKPITFTDSELRLRLPVDETSFEMGVHSTLPEYLYLPAVRTQYASEFGHLIRIVSIYAKVEYALDEMSEALGNPAATLMEAEQKMEEWVRTLPEHLRFSEQSLQVQQSMFETSSNTGAWSWCYMHVYHASCVLALNFARQRAQRGPRSDSPEALETLELILKMLGDRAKNSILMGAALWPLIKFCKRDDAQVRHWASIYEEAFGTKISELVQDWRSHPSPSEQHQYPPHLLLQPQQTQQQQEQEQHNHVHSHVHNIQHHHQLANRRLSDVRNANSQINIGLSNTNPNSRSPHKHGEPSPSYNNGSSNITSNNNLSHKSANNLPSTPYPLGRPANSGSNASNNRTIGMNPHTTSGFPDPSGTGNSNRDSRISLTAPGSSVVGTMGHSGNGNDCLNPNATLLGKYVDREANAQAVNSLSRWPLLAGDSCGVGGGGAGDSGMQQHEFGGPGGQVIIGGSGNGSVGVGGAVVAGNGNVNAQRNLTLLGDGAQSLPSLKDSGLLESWGSSRATVAVDTQKQAANGPPQQQQQQQSLTVPSRTTTLGSSISAALPSTTQQYALHQHQDVADLRPTTTLGMPVGMSWLANE
ncbi:hypothetical protein BYT27DRAFT_7237433 [Phlegmacium glaucopus]|nr:hypothetical protein BYT27DRAFT_7237433 [Phlegmacium glaucopus]